MSEPCETGLPSFRSRRAAMAAEPGTEPIRCPHCELWHRRLKRGKVGYREHDILLDEYVFLKSMGESDAMIAKAMKVRSDTFERMMQKARAEGDPRAAEYIRN